MTCRWVNWLIDPKTNHLRIVWVIDWQIKLTVDWSMHTFPTKMIFLPFKTRAFFQHQDIFNIISNELLICHTQCPRSYLKKCSAQEGGGVSRVNIGRLITTSATSRHTSMFFQNGGQFSCSLFLQKMTIFRRSGKLFCRARMTKHLKNRKE